MILRGLLVLFAAGCCKVAPTGPPVPVVEMRSPLPCDGSFPGPHDIPCLTEEGIAVFPPITPIVKMGGIHDPFTFTVDWTSMPVLVWGGSEDYVLRRRFEIPLPDCYEITAVKTFLGLEPGDLVETDISIWTFRGQFVHERSYHRAVNAAYEAWEPWEVFASDARPRACGIVVGLVGRVTGRQSDPANPRHGELSALFHYGVRFHAIRD